jgi:hypothetical protein
VSIIFVEYYIRGWCEKAGGWDSKGRFREGSSPQRGEEGHPDQIGVTPCVENRGAELDGGIYQWYILIER